MGSIKYIYIIICCISLLLIKYGAAGRLLTEPLVVASLLTYYVTKVKVQHSMVLLTFTFLIITEVTTQYNSNIFWQLTYAGYILAAIMLSVYLRQFTEKALNRTQKLFIIISAALSILWATNVVVSNEYLYLKLLLVILTFLLSFYCIRFPRLNKEISLIGIGGFTYLTYFTLSEYAQYKGYDALSIRYPLEIIYYIAIYCIFYGVAEDAREYFERKEKVIALVAKDNKKKKKRNG